MNNKQRKRIQTILDELYEIQEEEQEKYDNAPEGLQDTDRVYKFQENADEIEDIILSLESLMED